MADVTPTQAQQEVQANVNWHTWASGIVNNVFTAMVGAALTAIVAYFGSHPMPPVIPAPAPIIVQPTTAPTELTAEQIQQAIDALKKKQK